MGRQQLRRGQNDKRFGLIRNVISSGYSAKAKFPSVQRIIFLLIHLTLTLVLIFHLFSHVRKFLWIIDINVVAINLLTKTDFEKMR